MLHHNTWSQMPCVMMMLMIPVCFLRGLLPDEFASWYSCTAIFFSSSILLESSTQGAQDIMDRELQRPIIITGAFHFLILHHNIKTWIHVPPLMMLMIMLMGLLPDGFASCHSCTANFFSLSSILLESSTPGAQDIKDQCWIPWSQGHFISSWCITTSTPESKCTGWWSSWVCFLMGFASCHCWTGIFSRLQFSWKTPKTYNCLQVIEISISQVLDSSWIGILPFKITTFSYSHLVCVLSACSLHHLRITTAFRLQTWKNSCLVSLKDFKTVCQILNGSLNFFIPELD